MKIHISVLVLFCLLANTLKAQHASEFQVKAAFLFNFSKFLDWPPNSFSTPYDPFIIGVYGNDPFGKYLEEIIAEEKVMGRPMIVERLKEPDDIKKCHILFINQPGKTAQALSVAKGLGILTVSDDPAFCAAGGMIRFYKEKDMIRLQINLDAAKAANLTISSKLLRISKICE